LDFWDITKLLVRRWQVALPMLLLSAVITGVTVSQVKPDYVGSAYVQLVPPAPTKNTTPEQALTTADQRNPWLTQGLQTLGNAAIVQAQDLSVVEDLKKAGHADTYTVTMGQNSALVTFEITGTSARQARETAEKLVGIFTKSVETLQTSLGVSGGSLITVKRLDLGANVKKSTSKIKRALVAVAAAGILLSAGITVGADAWLRRRGKRPGQFDGDDLDSSATTPLPTGGSARDRVINGGVRQGPAAADAAARPGASDLGLTVEYQRPANRDTNADKIPVLDAESTVVLPLSALPPNKTAKRAKSN
jgi:capsular polysaccharide biosynthesis protein